MLPINAIEVREPVRDHDVRAGSFTYKDLSGDVVTRPFYVRTVAAKSDDNLDAGHRASLRQSDLNQQMGDAWVMLMESGYTSIAYADIRPNPFF